MDIKAILFDKDGTLIDFADTFFDACALVIHELSQGDGILAGKLAEAVEFDLETKSCTAESQIVGGTAFTIAQCWQEILQIGDAQSLATELDTYFDKYTMESVTVFDFTKPTLEQLAEQGLSLGVATNDSESNARNHLAPHGLEPMFSFIAGYDSGYGPKPQPGMVEAFASHARVANNQVAMVGDSINDLLAARHAGAIAIAVTSGIANSTELEPYADIVIGDISLLPDIVTQH